MEIRVSPTALLLIAVFVAAASPLCLGAVLLAALCHELGHYGALRLCGRRLEGVRLGVRGTDAHS
ncbi:MAG: hypothetical protein ACLUNQ_07435 [Oscillospiraceae bacterium]